jgi:molybdopterin-guanine dinucleotide biosynthesis protein A
MATTCNASDATLAILAGGEGSRMGRPKGLLRIEGQPILEYLHRRFAWPGPTCLITAPGRQNPPGASVFDRELVDPESGSGPLRGILTSLENLGTPLLVVATVDMPLLENLHLRHLLSGLQNRLDTLGLMYERPHGGHIVLEPFPLALRQEAIEVVRLRLTGGDRSVKHLLQEQSFQTIAAPECLLPFIWTNLNEPGDLEAFGRLRAPPDLK